LLHCRQETLRTSVGATLCPSRLSTSGSHVLSAYGCFHLWVCPLMGVSTYGCVNLRVSTTCVHAATMKTTASTCGDMTPLLRTAYVRILTTLEDCQLRRTSTIPMRALLNALGLLHHSSLGLRIDPFSHLLATKRMKHNQSHTVDYDT
jgi:hypothetical protein